MDKPILLYHAIQQRDSRSRSPNRTASAQQFELQMQWLDERGYRVVSLPDLLLNGEGQDARGEKNIGLTFDDGYQDFLTVAFPILRHHRFTATVFLVTEQVGAKSRWDGANNDWLLTWEEVRDLFRHGITFGSHTCTHPRLLRLPSEQVWDELVVSKKRIEAELDRETAFLAYPYGESNSEIRTLASRAGYKAACGVITGDPGRFNLWRRETDSSESAGSLAMKLAPWYVRINLLRKWARENTALGRYLRALKQRGAPACTKAG